MRFSRFFLIAAPAVPILCACTVQTTNPPPPTVVVAQGTLEVDFSIDGIRDPNQCAQVVASAIQVSVFSMSTGQSAGVFEGPCSAFGTSISLSAGTYSARAVLVDAAGQPRTTAVSIDPFQIFGNDVVIIPVDFPAVSFF